MIRVAHILRFISEDHIVLNRQTMTLIMMSSARDHKLWRNTMIFELKVLICKHLYIEHRTQTALLSWFHVIVPISNCPLRSFCNLLERYQELDCVMHILPDLTSNIYRSAQPSECRPNPFVGDMSSEWSACALQAIERLEKRKQTLALVQNGSQFVVMVSIRWVHDSLANHKFVIDPRRGKKLHIISYPVKLMPR